MTGTGAALSQSALTQSFLAPLTKALDALPILWFPLLLVAIFALRGAANFLGDLALHWLARGGVYLAGGIAAKLMPHFDNAPFIDAFLAKREHRHLAEDMPIRLVTDESLGLRGTLALASRCG